MASNSDSEANVATIAGPVLIASCLTWGLFTLHSSQVYTYHTRFGNGKDPASLKFMVYVIYLIGVAQVAIVTHDTYLSLALGFGDRDALSRTYFTWLTAPVYASIVALLVHAFYAYRIYILSNRSFLCAIFIMLLALLHCGSGLAVGILSSQKESILNLNSYLSIRIAQGIWTVTCAGCDVIIALCMSFFLSRQKSSLYPSTQAIIARLLRLIVGYGALTAAAAIVTLILFNTAGGSLLFSPSSIVLGRLYSSSMMVLLNGRKPMSDTESQDSPVSSTLSYCKNKDEQRSRTFSNASSLDSDSELYTSWHSIDAVEEGKSVFVLGGIVQSA